MYRLKYIVYSYIQFTYCETHFIIHEENTKEIMSMKESVYPHTEF